MSRKPGCKVTLEAKEVIKEAFQDKRMLNELGEAIKDEALNLISKGISPVSGEGRFEAYRAQRSAKTERPKKKRVRAGRITKIVRSVKKNIQKLLRSRKVRPSTAKKFGITNRGYPFSVQKKYPGKNVRPVNMELSGEMLKYLRHDVIDEGIRFGILGAPSDVDVRARVHNTGERDDIPKRKFVPWEPGDKWVPSIQKRIRQVLQEHILDVIKRMATKK